MNFVKWYKYPIVFNNITKIDESQYKITYAGSLEQIFDPKRLLMDNEGHFLHPLDDHKHLKYGSFDTSLSVALGEKVIIEENGEMFIEWDNIQHKLSSHSPNSII